MGVVNSRSSGKYQIRYLRCSNCPKTGKEIIRSCDVRRRKSRTGNGSGSVIPIRAQLRSKTRFDVLQRDGFCCVYCGQKPPSVELHVDHVVPVVRGGSNDISNLVSSCAECNRGKGKRTA
jgi:5-methylcytosine-specific restriction endonuclease McrA